MRRVAVAQVARYGAVAMRSLFPTTEESSTLETLRNMMQKGEMEQQQREAAVDTRQVIFSSAASADHRPRIAAAEAFDVAAAALPRAPNFCYLTVSLDFAAMIDAPEVIWFNLCKCNDVSPSTVKPQSLHMMGGAVCQQRPGGGYIQVLLGCVPDLQTDVFTFDTVPEADEIHDPKRLPPAACFAFLDGKLSLSYEQVLSSHLNTLAGRLGKNCPLVGGLYPSIQMEKDVSGDDLADSVFFVGDRVYKGSAAAVILRSDLLKAQAFSVVPSISIGKARVSDVSVQDGVAVIKLIDGKPATDVIRGLYVDEMSDKRGKIFLGLAHNGMHIPVTFLGNPDTGHLQLFLPPNVQLMPGDVVDFLVDDSELDVEVAAGCLISLEKKVSPVSVEKDISVARETRRNVIASSTAGFHFSHNGLNIKAEPDVATISLGNSNLLFAPSVLQRCAGRTCATSGYFCPGQVATVGDTSGIFARSSTYCFLQGLA